MVREAFTAAVAAVCLLGGPGNASAQDLTVAAASDLQAVLPAIAAQFEKDTGYPVRLAFGSSGNFFAQIQNGAPFDVFLSADVGYPMRLEASGFAEPGSLYEYARGRLVLWTRRDSGIDVAAGLEVLRSKKVRRISIANPEHAPYGRAAAAALHRESLYDAIRGKLVLGENISQAAQFVQSGSADVGLIALSLALSPALKNSGSYVEVPESLYPPINQAAIVVARSSQKAMARRFIDLLKTPQTAQILQAYGFAPAASPPR